MAFEKYDSDKLFILVHGTGFGEQGGEPLQTHEIIYETDDLNEGKAFGDKMFPKDPSGWTYDWYKVNINLNHPKGQKLFEKWSAEFDKKFKYAEEHPELYTKIETTDGQVIYLQKIDKYDTPVQPEQSLTSYKMTFIDFNKN